jgi:transcription initiation factor TFIIB
MEEAKSVRGRNSEALIAACIYTALRLEKSARTMKEITALTNVSKKEIGKCYKLILKTQPGLDVITITYTDYIVKIFQR